MRDLITFEKIDTDEKWRELQRFATEFGHTINDATLTPLVAVRRGRKLFAYFSFPTFPIIFPAFHPKYTTRRDFIESIEQVRAWQWLNTVGHERFPHGCFWAAFDKDPVVPRELIEKMNFKPTGCELWQSFVKEGAQ